MHSIASNTVVICACAMNLPYCDVHTVLCVGANADIKDNKGRTPMQRAQEKLADELNPERKQHYEKVDDDIYIITHFEINSQWVLTGTLHTFLILASQA